jgi:hypothetical protein
LTLKVDGVLEKKILKTGGDYQRSAADPSVFISKRSRQQIIMEAHHNNKGSDKSVQILASIFY